MDTGLRIATIIRYIKCGVDREQEAYATRAENDSQRVTAMMTVRTSYPLMRMSNCAAVKGVSIRSMCKISVVVWEWTRTRDMVDAVEMVVVMKKRRLV